MKAAVFQALGSPLSIETIGMPIPQKGEVVIKVARCGICGSDLHMTEDPVAHPSAGTVLGHEYAGDVVEVGPGVERVRVGDRVVVVPLGSCGRCAACLSGEFAWCRELQLQGGGYAQFALAHERQCVKLPSTISSEDGALVEPLAVGLHGVKRSGLTAGARVLVIGAGPIGLAAAFWARKLGASTVAVTASSRQREALALGMGASHFIDPADKSPEAVERILGGAPDIVFECVGKQGLIEQSISYVRPRGTVVVLGICFGRDSFMPLQAMMKEIRIEMAVLYGVRDFEISIDALDAGHVEPRSMITDQVSLDAMPEIFEAMRHRTTQCKVLVVPH